MKEKGLIFTIGHSTMPLDKFISVLKENSIELVADVRTIPRSRHNPQFNLETLPGELAKAGLEYRHLGALGGLRHTRPDSINTAWINASFRGFADYMQTSEFEKGLKELIKISRSRRSVIMCAEALPWRCHRSLISDALAVRGCHVEHITGTGQPHPHRLTSFARVEGRNVTYPRQDTGLK
jgi:uncharacterized protein (DUF488 family)